ncbi:MAG: hypothetical protein KTR30_21075 [Saprospiraceae bacterium]|nr:hypothetical protein [Saprospiraceae bacterium]
MSTKTFLVATIVAFLVSNVLTTFWYMMMDAPNVVPFRRETMNYGLLMLNHMIYAALMVYLFPYYRAKHSGLGRAFQFGVLIAALMYIPQALVIRSIWTVDVNAIFVLNTLAHLVIGGVMGIAINYLTRNALAS